MATDEMMSIAMRVSLIVLVAVIVIFLIVYYSNPAKKPQDTSESKGVEKFNSGEPTTSEEPKRAVRFAEPAAAAATAKAAAPTSTNKPAPVAASWSQGLAPTTPSAHAHEPQPLDPHGLEDYIAVDYETQPRSAGAAAANGFPQDRTRPEDLLPKDAANSKWAQVAPAGQGDVKNQNFLTAGFHIGKDTIGVSRKNPNLSIRGEPPNPKSVVSPWMNSSIEPDQFRRMFEIGEA